MLLKLAIDLFPAAPRMKLQQARQQIKKAGPYLKIPALHQVCKTCLSWKCFHSKASQLAHLCLLSIFSISYEDSYASQDAASNVLSMQDGCWLPVLHIAAYHLQASVIGILRLLS